MPNAVSLPSTVDELRLRAVLRAGAELWEREKGSLARIAGLAALTEVGLALAMRAGLYGTIVDVVRFTPDGILAALAPWNAVREGATLPVTGSLGRAAGFLGILGSFAAFLGTLALLRALSLALHGHTVSLRESYRTALRRTPCSLVVLAWQLLSVLIGPALAVATLVLLHRALDVLRLGGTLGAVLAWAPPVAAVLLGAAAAWFTLDRLARVAFALPALVDQGLGVRAALTEAARLTSGLRRFTVVGILVVLLLSTVISVVFPVVLGSGIGLLSLPPDVATLLLAVLLVAGRAFTDALVLAWGYVLYRSVLSVKGGATRRARA